MGKLFGPHGILAAIPKGATSEKTNCHSAIGGPVSLLYVDGLKGSLASDSLQLFFAVFPYFRNVSPHNAERSLSWIKNEMCPFGASVEGS